MILSNSRLHSQINHKCSILSLFHFDSNNKDHFMTLSEDGELKEWGVNTETSSFMEIGPCVLVRPSDEILIQNKHKVPKIPKNDFISITKTLFFKNFIVLGYEDGLILVYQQNVQNWEKENEKDNTGQENKTDNKEINCYSNYFSLYYILLGHSQKITSLFYVESTNMLVTASDNCIVKIYDMETGHSLFHFNLDCVVDYILKKKKKSDKYLALICQEPYKLVINISKEPLSFNHYTFKYNNICQILPIKQDYYLLGKTSVIYLFNKYFEYQCEFTEGNKVDYQYFVQFNEKFCIFDLEGYMRFVNLNPKTNEIETEFKIRIGDDAISDCLVADKKYLLMTCCDGKVYGLDINKEIDLVWERNKMIEEEKLSEDMNKILDSKKNKKGGKGKEKEKEKGNKGEKKEKLPKIKTEKKGGTKKKK